MHCWLALMMSKRNPTRICQQFEITLQTSLKANCDVTWDRTTKLLFEATLHHPRAEDGLSLAEFQGFELWVFPSSVPDCRLIRLFFLFIAAG